MSRKIKAGAMAAIRKLKAILSETIRYPRVDRSVQLFLPTSQPDYGAIDLPPQVFMGMMQVQFLSIGPLFWPRNEMGSSESVPLSALSLRPNSKDSRSE